MEILDACFRIINDAEQDTHLNYTKYYVGVTLNSRHLNIARLMPKHSFLKAEVFVADADEWIKKLEAVRFKVHLSGRRDERFKFRINYEDIVPNELLLRELFVGAYAYCRG